MSSENKDRCWEGYEPNPWQESLRKGLLSAK